MSLQIQGRAGALVMELQNLWPGTCQEEMSQVSVEEEGHSGTPGCSAPGTTWWQQACPLEVMGCSVTRLGAQSRV